MITSKFNHLLLFAALGLLGSGCYSLPPRSVSVESRARTEARVDFNDPVLNERKILLIGPIDEPAAALMIQKLLYLDSKSHEPIDIFLQTPGGELKSAFAIEQTMRLIQSPLNTYALSECNSGGVLLLAAGTGKRRAFHNAVIVLHGLVISGKAPEGFVDQIQASYTEFWQKRTRVPAAWLPLPFNSTRVLSAKQALEHGIVDEVIDK